MKQDPEMRSERVKFVYNAQFPAATAVLVKYLVHNPHFTNRQGRQQDLDGRPMAEAFHGEVSVVSLRTAGEGASLCGATGKTD